MKRLYFLFFFSSLLLSTNVFGQGKGTIIGTITDGGLDEPLGFAAVGITLLNVGTTTDVDGKYRLAGIPAGVHQLEFSYLGYETITLEATVVANKTVTVDVTLREGGLTMDEVVIVGQAVGQRAAINRQINSNTIVNVISKEKLQELPDQNAAESVGRLAGVSVYRDAGEGQQVSIRGISPRFNAITVNGERLPSTETDTRAVDLSMISADALEGIELFKAIRPDMDGDAIGGTVNFTIKKADKGFRGVVRMLGGYNDLKKDWGQFRGSGSIGNRFFGNKLGVIATANYQQITRSNEFNNTAYEFTGNNPETGEPIIQVETFNLGDRLEKRKRYGGGVTMDYEFNENHSIVVSSNLSQLDRDDRDFRRRYRIANNEQRFTAQERERSTFLTTNSASGKHQMGAFSVNWRGSYSKSEQKTPFNLRGQYWELAATNTGIGQNTDLAAIPPIFKNDIANTSLRDIRLVADFVEEQNQTFQLDLKYDFVAGKQVNGFFKVGGKYRGVRRSSDRNENFFRPYLTEDNPGEDNPQFFAVRPDGSRNILMANFLGDYTNPNYFDGDFDILPGDEALRNSVTTSLEGVDLATYNEIFGTDYQPGDVLRYDGHIDHAKQKAFYRYFEDEFAIVNQERDLEDYDGREDIYATYAMAELNFSKWLMLMGGVRFERTDQEYTSRRGSPVEEDEGGSGFLNLVNVAASQGYSEFLPMAHLRLKPVEWFDVRLAATKTLARPNFFNLVPWERINNSEQVIDRGKPDLKHTTAWNYDAFLSFYNKFGLLTIGGFYKQLDNIDYVKSTAIVDSENIFNGYRLNEPANVIGQSDVRGVEIDLQGTLRPLNNFLKGVVWGVNVTLAESETFYPVFDVTTEFIPTPPFFVTSVLDTVRSGPIAGQADLIANFMLGYEKGGFSGRISSIYQDRTLSPGNSGIGRAGSGVGRIPELDFFDSSYWRFDLALKQTVGKKKDFTIILNVNNITNTPERALLGTNNLLTEDEYFGLTAEFGVMYKFK